MFTTHTKKLICGRCVVFLSHFRPCVQNHMFAECLADEFPGETNRAELLFVLTGKRMSFHERADEYPVLRFVSKDVPYTSQLVLGSQLLWTCESCCFSLPLNSKCFFLFKPAHSIVEVWTWGFHSWMGLWKTFELECDSGNRRWWHIASGTLKRKFVLITSERGISDIN